MNRIKMFINSELYEIELYNNPSSKALYETLPQRISMSIWGGEYYGPLSVKIPSDGEKRDTFEKGEVALWPSGNAFCIFFGPTPVSLGNEPRMASPGIPFGKIISDNLNDFDEMGGSITIKLDK
ncbi:MAG: hypothetical protein K0R31_1254 [Clostridiales bacterium]|jgi:hypothetical protein|nr:hypothetical protein [Clostridiales bacterium]